VWGEFEMENSFPTFLFYGYAPSNNKPIDGDLSVS
jgi:hypothetical protein